MAPAVEAGAVGATLLITAEEAYPAFERAVLAARHEIVAGFRIFDLRTRLQSPEARAVGHDWFDLLLDALNRGVSVRLTLSDFDAVVATALHGQTWRTLRHAAALREMAGPDARLDVRAALHPARLAVLARLALWPKVSLMLRDHARRVAAMPEGRRARFLQEHPLLAPKLARLEERHAPMRWFLPHLAPLTHHQKVAVIDACIVYWGGLDLNDRRYDTKRHDQPAERTWHDVQMLLHDPELAALTLAHLDSFVAVTHRVADPPDSHGRTLRTLSTRSRGGIRLFSPRRLLTEIETEVLRGIAGAERLIYLETQYLRDRRVARALARAARERPALELFVVLPAAPEDVAFGRSSRSDARFGEFLQARCIRTLRRAFGTRLFVGAPVRGVPSSSTGRDALFGAPLIYVHAKVCLFDDRHAIVGSANLNGRSLRWDTEFGVPLRGGVAAMRRRLLEHWAGPDASADLVDADRCVAAWRDRARRNARLPPADRMGLLVPYAVGPAERFGTNLPGLPEEMV